MSAKRGNRVKTQKADQVAAAGPEVSAVVQGAVVEVEVEVEVEVVAVLAVEVEAEAAGINRGRHSKGDYLPGIGASPS